MERLNEYAAVELRILHLEDNPFDQDCLRKALFEHGLNCKDRGKLTYRSASSIEEAELLCQSHSFDVMVLDLHLQGVANYRVSDLQKTLLKNAISHNLPLWLVLSRSNDIHSIVEALGAGADDFMIKGDGSDHIAARIWELWLRKSQHATKSSTTGHQTIGKNVAVTFGFAGRHAASIAQQLELIAGSPIRSILVHGESGSGKEMVASMLRHLLPKGTPFISFNCASLAPQLIHSELFGYQKGAFTGALQDKMGLLETANGGWVFLDEIAELSLDAQAALLRTLESGEIRKLGSNRSHKIDIRIVAATHASLPKLVQGGSFRMDLLQRLQDYTFEILPLRQRPQEIPEIAQSLVAEMDDGRYILESALAAYLCQQTWEQGNVRQLRGFLRTLAAFHMDRRIGIFSLKQLHSLQSEHQHELSEVSNEDQNPSASPTLPTLELNLPSLGQISFEQLTDQLLVKYIQRRKQQSTLSLRKLSEELHLARGTMTQRLKRYLENHPQSEVRSWLRKSVHFSQ